MTTDTLLSDALKPYVQSNIRIARPQTVAHYERCIRQFSEFLNRPATLADLTDDNAIGFIKWTLAEGRSPATANQRVKQIRSLWNWLAKRRLVEMFPTFADASEAEPNPIAWTLDELHQLFATCARQKGYMAQHFASTWWLSIHWWWFATAERTEATMLLRRSMVNVDRQIVRVPAEIRKGGRKNQVYKLPDRLCELFDEMFRTPTRTGLVFDHPWKRWQGLFHAYRDLIREAGLPYVRGKSGPKKMRITAYTMMESGGLDASKFARHSSRDVTQHYIDQGELMISKKANWPPSNFNPEAKPPRSWHNGFGLFGA